MNEGLACKRSYLAVLGCIMQNTSLLNNMDRPLERSDFDTEPFYELLFVAMYNLYIQGCEKIDEFTIDSYLSQHQAQYKIFQDNNGLEYLASAQEMADPNNYEFFYHRLRKYSLLRYYSSKGYDTKQLYDNSATDPSRVEEEQIKFDNYTEQDIIEKIENDLVINPKMKYCTNTLTIDNQAGDNLEELINELMETPDVGIPLTSMALNTVCRGARKGKLYLRSALTSGGKSRQAAMDACHFAVPYIYNLETNTWDYTGFSEPTLYITTEMTVDEVQTILIATVSGVNEEHILYGNYKPGELERVRQATTYIKSSPLYISFCPDFNLQDIENIIKKYHNTYRTEYIMFDYLHTSLRLMTELATKSTVKMAEYQLLTIFSTRLKALAEQLDIFIFTSTQLTAETADAKYKDQNLLAGSKAIANKIDIGVICMRPTDAELKKIGSIINKKINCPEVNLATWVYKVRRGKLTKIVIFSHIDLGTMRIQDLFVTDFDLNLIDIDFTQIEHVDKVVEEHSHIMKDEDFEPTVETPVEENVTVKFDW